MALETQQCPGSCFLGQTIVFSQCPILVIKLVDYLEGCHSWTLAVHCIQRIEEFEASYASAVSIRARWSLDQPQQAPFVGKYSLWLHYFLWQIAGLFRVSKVSHLGFRSWTMLGSDPPRSKATLLVGTTCYWSDRNPSSAGCTDR